MFKAWIGNLGKYNEGELVGEWLEFPCDEEDWDACMQRIGIGSTDEFGQPYDEIFVADYDSDIIPVDLGEYPTFDELNEYAEKAEELSDLDDTYGEGFAYSLIKEVGDVDEVLDNVDDLTVIEQDSWGDGHSDVGYYWVDAIGGPEELDKDTLEMYFDYEALGRDLGFDEYENDDYDPDDPDSEEYITAGEYWCGDEYASDYDIGVAFVDEVGFDGVSDPGAYFDYDAYGRDITINENYYHIKTDDYTYYWVEIPY